jgi:sodium transport system permease protein
MVLIAGLAFFLNLVPGTGLQWASARWGLVLSQLLFIAGPTALGIRWFYLDPAAVLPWRRPRPAEIAAALVGTLGLNHLLTLYGTWQDRVFPTPEVLRALFDGLFVYRGPIDFALLLVAFALLPAICEEMLFRGFLQGGLVRLLERPGRGIAASAIVFGLFHLDPWRFVGITVLGLFLGYLRHATGSLLPAMVAHAANNIVSVSLAAAGHLEEGRLPGSALTAVVALLLVGAAPLLLRHGRTAGDSAAGVL